MKKILVPCDFSDSSENALQYSIKAAESFGADLVLVHINQYPVVAPDIGLSSYTYQDADKDSLDALSKLKTTIINKGFRGNIDCFSEMGEVSESIEKFAHEQGADLIVMGISGHGSSFMKNLVGSAAVDVSNQIDIPVLIIPPGYQYKKPQTVVYACHYEEQIMIEPGFLKLKELTDFLGAQLQLLHVIEEKTVSEKFPLHESYEEHPGAPAGIKTFVIHEKHAAQAILHFLDDHAVDIIGIHPKKHPLIERLFKSSVTSEIAFNSKVPVLTVH